MPEYYIYFGYGEGENGDSGVKIISALKKMGYFLKGPRDDWGVIEYISKQNSIDLILSKERTEGLNKIIFYPAKAKNEEEELKEVRDLVNRLRREGVQIKNIRDIKNKPVNV